MENHDRLQTQHIEEQQPLFVFYLSRDNRAHAAVEIKLLKLFNGCIICCSSGLHTLCTKMDLFSVNKRIIFLSKFKFRLKHPDKSSQEQTFASSYPTTLFHENEYDLFWCLLLFWLAHEPLDSSCNN